MTVKAKTASMVVKNALLSPQNLFPRGCRCTAAVLDILTKLFKGFNFFETFVANRWVAF